MKILKLLNKKNCTFFLFIIFLSSSIANEPADIWNIDKTKIETEENSKNETLVEMDNSEESISVYDLNSQKNENEKNQVLLENTIENKISLYGLYDPDVNNLSMSSTKSSTGHLLGASGSVEFIFSALSIKNQIAHFLSYLRRS